MLAAPGLQPALQAPVLPASAWGLRRAPRRRASGGAQRPGLAVVAAAGGNGPAGALRTSSGRIALTERERLKNPAKIGGKSLHTVAVKDQGGAVSLDAYMRLPVSQYDHLEPNLIQPLGGNAFLLKMPRISVLGVWVAPEVEVVVTQREGPTGRAPRVVLESRSCRLIGSPAPFFQDLQSRFALHFVTELSWRPSAPLGGPPTSSSGSRSSSVLSTAYSNEHSNGHSPSSAAAVAAAAVAASSAAAAEEPVGRPQPPPYLPAQRARRGLLAQVAAAAAPLATAGAVGAVPGSPGKGYAGEAGRLGGVVREPADVAQIARNLAFSTAAPAPPAAVAAQKAAQGLQPQLRRQPPPQAQRPQQPQQGGQQQQPRAGEISGNLRVDVWAETPPPFDMFPRSVLENSCNAVLNTVIGAMLPLFMRRLGEDYAKWATDPAYRQSRSARQS